MKLVQDNKFIEHAEFSGNFYGTSEGAVQAVVKGEKTCILDIDTQVCWWLPSVEVVGLRLFPSSEGRFVVLEGKRALDLFEELATSTLLMTNLFPHTGSQINQSPPRPSRPPLRFHLPALSF